MIAKVALVAAIALFASRVTFGNHYSSCWEDFAFTVLDMTIAAAPSQKGCIARGVRNRRLILPSLAHRVIPLQGSASVAF